MEECFFSLFLTQKCLRREKEKADFSAVCFLFPPNTLRFLRAIKTGPGIPGLNSVFPWGQAPSPQSPGSSQSTVFKHGLSNPETIFFVGQPQALRFFRGGVFFRRKTAQFPCARRVYFQKLLGEGVTPAPTWRVLSLGVSGEPLRFSFLFPARASFLCPLLLGGFTTGKDKHFLLTA